MGYSRITGLFAAKLHMSVGSLMILTAVVSCFLAMPGVDWLISLLREKSNIPPTEKAQAKYLVWFGLSAALIMLVCTKSSPLYPLNDWYDLNCFFTIGRGMRHGLIPYRDLIDHKGPLFYMLFYLAALVTEQSYFGVYLLEWVCCFAFLCICWQIVKSSSPAGIVWVIPAFAAALYSAPAFTHGGSAEEICVPLLAYGFLVGYRAMAAGKLPDSREFFFIGVTSGAVLFIKFTMLGFYIGWIIVPAVLAWKQRRLAELFKGLGFIALGVTVIGAVPVVYLMLHGALKDMLTVYFYNSIFVYSEKIGGLGFDFQSFYIGTGKMLSASFPALVLAVLGLVRCTSRENHWVTAWYCATAAGLTLFQGYCCGELAYYGFILTAMAPLGLALICEVISDCLPAGSCRQAILGLSTAAVLALMLTPNREMMFRSKADTPQGVFAAEIAEAGLENPQMINYMFLDGGFYMAAGILPNEPYFMKMGMLSEEIRKHQLACINGGRVDFIVTIESDASFDGFELIDRYPTVVEEMNVTYRLYARQGLLTPRVSAAQ